MITLTAIQLSTIIIGTFSFAFFIFVIGTFWGGELQQKIFTKLMEDYLPLVPRTEIPRHIFTAPGCVITYSLIPDFTERFAEVDRRFTEIIAAKPDADFTNYETPLKINIMTVERSPEPKPKPPTLSPNDDVPVGWTDES